MAYGCAFVCLCVYVLSHVQLFALKQWHMGVCVCVYVCMLSRVQLFALKQWHMGLCVCVCTQLCPTVCVGAVAYEGVCVYAHAC